MKLTNKVILAFLVVIFVYSGIDKVFHFAGFVNALWNYVLVPTGWAPFLAGPVIAIEIAIGIGLLIPVLRRPAALTAAAVLVVFTAALIVNYLYGGRGVCGCWFTITLAKSSGMHVAQNLVMIALALTIWWDTGTYSRASLSPQRA